MKHLKKKRFPILFMCLCLLLSICSCSKKKEEPVPSISELTDDSDPSKKGTRDNTPVVLVPTADGIEVYSCPVASIDASNSSDGYIIVDYFGTNSKVKLQITGPDSVTYTYNLHGGQEVFPLTAESGSYVINVFENIQGTQYATVLTSAIEVNLTNEFGPYLYPNQYVNFNASSLPISMAQKLAYRANEDLEVVQNVYNYIIATFSYDYDKAKTVQSGYLPDVDEIYRINTGICFDYAAVMATMLRSQRIPTRLEVGYMGEQYHAWISTYIKDVGWVNGIIEFDGTNWKLLDPTFASTSKSPQKFITENNKYITKYLY